MRRGASGLIRPSQAVVRALLQAFTQQRLAAIQYQDAQGTHSRRTIEAQYLYYSLPTWYVVAWDCLRDDIRTFRIDRISSATLLEDAFRLRKPDAFLVAGETDARSL